ncbi:early endosome antigen 1 [Rhizoctonia solani]|uniref:Early endosome antigen 1 n=1 Tax=Rhizoctonia solani TaxID=456999 RepID=A0A0K6GIF1_9AGAM|nr:early endosome antigen 1 [Rhizoctonia solani]
MAYRLETPSRIWARIEQAQDEELPSLPSMPEYEDSAFPDESEGISIQHSYYPTPNKAKTPSTYTPTPRPAKIRAMSSPLSAGETTARPPLGRSGSSLARSRDNLPNEYANKDDEEISTSLTDALETDSRSDSPDEFDDNHSRVSAPPRSIKDIYNHSVTSLRDTDQARRSNNLSDHIKPSPRARIPTQAPSPIPALTHSPRSVTSASSQHTPTIQRLPLSPSHYGSVSDRSRNSPSGSRPVSRSASRIAQELDTERDISYDSLPKEHSREKSASRSGSLSQSRLGARLSPRASIDAAPTPSESEITIDSVSGTSLSRSRSTPGQRVTNGLAVPASTSNDVPRRTSPAPTPAPTRTHYPIPQTPGDGLDGGLSNAPRQPPATANKLSRSFMMQVISSASRPTLRPKPTPFNRAKFQTPAARRLSEALAIDNGVGSSSFVSTASSHDLAIHRRANASFDAIAHARGGAGGDFDQRKLRIYLQSLNKHLSDENTAYRDEIAILKRACLELIDRLGARGVKVDQYTLLPTIDLEESPEEPRDQQVQVVEDVNDELVSALETARSETEAMRAELEAAREDATAAREEVVQVTEQCNAQMADLETDVQKVIEKLEDRLNEREAEAAQLRERLIDRSRDVHHEHAEELALEREHAAKLEAEVTQLTGELATANGESRNLKVELRELRASLRTEQAAGVERISALETENAKWRRKAQELERELEELDALVHDRDDDRNALLEDHDELARQKEEAQKEVARMEQALEDAEARIMKDAGQLKSLQGKVASLERERTDLLASRSTRDRSNPEDRIPLYEHEALVSDLEAQLDDAHREIARLTAKSPAGEALNKAKDLRIQQLEKEKDMLLERIQTMRSNSSATGGSNTPARATPSGSMALGRLAMMNLRTPKTPGAALKEASWMNQTTVHALGDADSLAARLVEVDARLVEANESIDQKLDKLEAAGAETINLTKSLYLSKEKITSLERELARLERREERLIKKLQRCRCTKCHMRFDASAVAQWAETTLPSMVDDLPTEPPTPETRTTRNLQSALAAANSQLENMRTDWQKLGQENAALREAGRQEAQLARQAEAEMKRELEEERKRAVEAAKGIKNEKERERALADMELERAKTSIAQLEEDLRAERGKLRSLAAEHSRVTRDKTDVLARLERTNQDMDVVKAQLDRFKNNNKELEKELRSNAIAETKARHLEARLHENNMQIDNLRSEREILTRDHEQLKKRFAEITERAETLRQRNAESQADHEKRQHKLDMQVTEIENLRVLLAEREAGMKDMATAMQTARGAQSDAERVVKSLQSELKRVKSEAEKLGTDIEHLKLERADENGGEKERQRRAREQAQTQMKTLNDQLQSAKDAAKQLQDRLKDHSAALSPAEVEKLKAMHSKECKGLVQQIGYLRSKFNRESEMREHMGWQKLYLMKILGVYAKSEPNIESALARQGFPHEQPPAKPRRTLRSIGYLVWWMVRAKRLAEEWREARRSRPAMRAALEDVRRRRPKSRTRT